MKITTPLLFFLLTSLPVSVYAGALREVELSDGSVVQAEVVGMRHGVYQLRSNTLGEFEVPESQVVAIRTPHSEPAPGEPVPAPASEWDGDVASRQPQQTLPAAGELQQALTQDPAALNKILSLQNDPLVQSILSDESTMQAVESGDLGALLNDPKIKALMNHPTVQDLGQSYGQ